MPTNATATSDHHTAAQRNPVNRLFGILYYCLHTRQRYNEAITFPPTHNNSTQAAA